MVERVEGTGIDAPKVHQPWCSHHLEDPCPVSGEPYVACQTIVEVTARPRGFGVYLVVWQEPGMPAPLARIESDSTGLTLAEVREFGQVLTGLLERVS